jgi:hypothetical protein
VRADRRARAIAAALFLFATSAADACRFARDAKPADWFHWANALFAADVLSIDEQRDKGLDVISLRVVETFKGPEGLDATLEVPRRMWASCRLERPAAGDRVLVALNPNSDTLLVPLSAPYQEQLRRYRRD